MPLSWFVLRILCLLLMCRFALRSSACPSSCSVLVCPSGSICLSCVPRSGCSSTSVCCYYVDFWCCCLPCSLGFGLTALLVLLCLAVFLMCLFVFVLVSLLSLFGLVSLCV